MGQGLCCIPHGARSRDDSEWIVRFKGFSSRSDAGGESWDSRLALDIPEHGSEPNAPKSISRSSRPANQRHLEHLT